MHALFDEFLEFLVKEDKERCVSWCLGKLDSGEIDIITLYTEILTPAQNELVCWQDETYCIWREHVRTSIIRTIVECCYPTIIRERVKYCKPRNEKVLIGCPIEEYHEIGARMAADFFTLVGFEVTFVGANTPQRELLGAIEFIKPKIIGVSVTNFYNLVSARKLVDELKRIRAEKKMDFAIIAGGNAFRNNPDARDEIGIDAVLQTFDEIKRYCLED